jgi:hypothetical protein
MKPQNRCTPLLKIWNFFGFWVLGFGVSLELGSWCLVLRHTATL